MPARSNIYAFMHLLGAKVAFATLICASGCASAEATAQAPRSPAREPAWLSGEIMGVDRVPIDQYNDSTVRLFVTTEAPEPVHLELGPGWYVEEQGLSFEPEQHIEYRGSPKPDGAITVYEIRQGSSEVRLRDPAGQPRWRANTKP